MIRITRIAWTIIVACAVQAPAAHADAVNGGKQAAEQCVKFQHARTDKQIASCCADMLDGQGGKKTQQECVQAGKEMVVGSQGAPDRKQ